MTDAHSARGPWEAEVKLVIASDEPGAIANELAGMSHLPGFDLLPGEKLLLKDTYYDSADRALSSKGWALRVRRSGGSILVALKGPTSDESSGVPVRIERESSWAPTLAPELESSLEQLGVGPTAHRDRDPSEPEQFLESLDLHVLTRRETKRLAKAVVPTSGKRAKAAASLVIDEVSDILEDGAVLHHEVEIEATERRNAPAVASIVAELNSGFGASLRPFPYSKLAIGLALQALRDRGELSTVVDEGRSLTAEGLSIIERELSRSAVSGPSRLES
jgi:hypothetical protein